MSVRVRAGRPLSCLVRGFLAPAFGVISRDGDRVVEEETNVAGLSELGLWRGGSCMGWEAVQGESGETQSDKNHRAHW